MLENLKLLPKYDGLLYLAEAERNYPLLKPHRHVELELNMVVRGSITYIVSGKRFTFPARTLLWLFPQQEHQLVDRSNTAQNYVAVFKPSLIARSCSSMAYNGLKQKRPGHEEVLSTLLDPRTFDLLRRIMDSLMRDALPPALLNREAGFGVASAFNFEHGDPDGLNAGLHHLLLLAWRSQRTGKALDEPVAIHPAVHRAIRLLSEEDWHSGLLPLAKACGVSEAYLSRTFHREIGISISRYRNSLRLSRFWEQYSQTTKKTLTEAVFGAGFGSYAQFFKVFVQAYGRGPRDILKEGANRH